MTVARIITAMAMLVCSFASEPEASRELLAAVLIAEAGGEGQAGLEAVMEVAQNRAGKKPVLAVVTKNVFSTLRGTTAEALIARSREHPRWVAALKLATNGTRTNHTRGATHFEATANPRPWWARHMTVTAVVGRQTFYREKKR